jgi:hypothetical protein
MSIFSKELSKVDQFRRQQQKMEEENKQRRRMLAEAIKQRFIVCDIFCYVHNIL